MVVDLKDKINTSKMRSSVTPSCAGSHFVFPSAANRHDHQEPSLQTPAVDDSNDYFDLKASMGQGATKEPVLPQSQADNGDFFSTTHTSAHPSTGAMPPFKPKMHSQFDSLSSIRSDQTLVESGFFNPRSFPKLGSTDTLFETVPSTELPLFAKPPKLATNFTTPSSSTPSSASADSASSSSSPPFLHKTPTSATEYSFFSRNTSSPTTATPTRPFMRHSASLSQDFPSMSRFNNSRINKDMVHPIPFNCRFISTLELHSHVVSPAHYIVVDVRPFGEYCKAHVPNAINICLSSTLLKRASFDLKRCLDSLPLPDKCAFTFYLDGHLQDGQLQQSPLPAVILYDTCSESEGNLSLSLSYTLSKFLQYKAWDSPVFVVKGGFQEYAKRYPDELVSHSDVNGSVNGNVNGSVHGNTNGNANGNCDISQHDRTNSNLFSTASPSSSPASSIMSVSSNPPKLSLNASAASKLGSGNSPILSRFVLPSPSVLVFKTRHNEEMLTSNPVSSIRLDESEQLSALELARLPTWMRHTIGEDHGRSSILKKFHFLETSERDRLRKVFSNCATKEEDCPEISCGVELGNKNRYKDILPYEHSRVKLNKKNSSCDYINASYISSNTSSHKYIATQGPLNDTIGDFWSLVVSHRSPMILSLTAQNEGGVEKCLPFWESGTYHELDDNWIKVENLEQVDDFKINENSKTPLTLRRLKITVVGSDDHVHLVHEILQIQILSWPDYGASIAKEDLLSLVALKNSILKISSFNNAPIIVHCSAGCGRTGTFCAIDSTLDFLLTSQRDSAYEEEDPILKTVECFRRQRISMVQTMTQYSLIYDTVLLFLRQDPNNHENKDLQYWDDKFNDINEGHQQVQHKTEHDPTNIDILLHFVKDLKLQ